MGRLPEQTQANLQMVGGLRQQQESTTMSLRSEQDRLAMLERQIEAMKRGAAEAPLSKAGGAASDDRIATLRRQLDEAAAMYTDKHPEIQRLKGEIASAQTLAEAERARPAAEREPALNADPAYRQLLTERETSRLRIREHERALARAEGEIAKYQGRVETAPMVEQQLSSVNREYELEKQQYNGLSERHQAAVLAEDLERRRAGEQFAVLYPAFLPSQPSSPDVPRVLLLAGLLGVLLGAVLVVGREYLDRSGTRRASAPERVRVACARGNPAHRYTLGGEMSRIQQILSKAERDGTARRMGLPETRHDSEVASAPYVPGTSFDTGVAAVAEPIDSPPLTTRHDFGVVDDDWPSESSDLSGRSSDAARVSVEAVLSPLLVAALDPLSPAAEQYRSLRSRIARAESAQPIRVIQITSPGKDEGKTVTAVNLTLTMAQEFQRRVLVVDTDLRRPSVHELLGLPAGPGLVDVLTGSATVEEALIEIPQYHLTVLRAGRTYDRPAEMLGSAPMRRLVDTLRTHFDRVVMDSAPAMVADSGAVAALADGLVLVVRAGSTTKPAIGRAIQTLGASKLLGLVFNASTSTQQTQYAASA